MKTLNKDRLLMIESKMERGSKCLCHIPNDGITLSKMHRKRANVGEVTLEEIGRHLSLKLAFLRKASDHYKEALEITENLMK